MAFGEDYIRDKDGLVYFRKDPDVLSDMASFVMDVDDETIKVRHIQNVGPIMHAMFEERMYNPSGMTRNRTMSHVGEIPLSVLNANKHLGEDDKALVKFIDSSPYSARRSMKGKRQGNIRVN